MEEHVIFAKTERIDAPLEKVLVIGLTFDECRHMLDNPGMTTMGFGSELDPDNQGGLHVMLFAMENNTEARAILESILPKMPR